MHIEKSTSSKPRVPQNLGESQFSIGGAQLIQNILSGLCLSGQPTFFHISWYMSYYHRWLLWISMSLDHCWESGLFLVSECWHIGILVSIVMLSESLRFVWFLCSGNCWGTHTAEWSHLAIDILCLYSELDIVFLSFHLISKACRVLAAFPSQMQAEFFQIFLPSPT